MRRVAAFVFRILVALSAMQLQQAAMAAGPAIFFYDANWQPVVRLDRLPAQVPALRALLALYALENGAGCGGKDKTGQVNCKLTATLGLGANCSDDHIKFVRTSLDSIPKLSPRWTDREASPEAPEALENLCYRQPDTASWRNAWEIIRVEVQNDTVNVEAILSWGSQYGHGRIRYEHIYKIEQGRVRVLSGKEAEISRITESANRSK